MGSPQCFFEFDFMVSQLPKNIQSKIRHSKYDIRYQILFRITGCWPTLITPDNTMLQPYRLPIRFRWVNAQNKLNKFVACLWNWRVEQEQPKMLITTKITTTWLKHIISWDKTANLSTPSTLTRSTTNEDYRWQGQMRACRFHFHLNSCSHCIYN